MERAAARWAGEGEGACMVIVVAMGVVGSAWGILGAVAGWCCGEVVRWFGEVV